MHEERLLERMRAQGPQRRARVDTGLAIDSVLRHLQLILNTRRGSVPIAAELGLPDFTDALRTYPDSVRELERALRQTIQRFEPRLGAVRVRFLPPDEGSLELRFEIGARLEVDEAREEVAFESRIDGDGKIAIRR